MQVNHLIEVDPYLIAFSQNNPRKRRGLDIDSLNALAASIKAQGLAQPILVRPLPGDRTLDTFEAREEGRPLPTYELVCGERRLRACRIAELDAIPMLVRDLDDQAALELQLVENIEREDLDAMEEAEGFELLRTKLGYTAEQIAERIGRGKGASYVYKTMKLLDLTPESREAMYEGHLGRSTGLLVARYPADQQAQVVQFIKSQAGAEPAPFREISPKVFTRFNLDLRKAVWMLADENLVPAAGACTTCHKRSGADSDLFGDDPQAPDSCTDPDCFDTKRLAHIDGVKAKAQKEGFKVIDGEEAKTAIPTPYQRYIVGFTRLDSTAYVEKGDDDTEREVTFEDALRSMGKKAPKPRILINPHTGEAIKVITNELADKLQPEQEEPDAHRAFPKEDERPADLRALDDYQTRRAVALRVFDSIRNRERTDADMLIIAESLFMLAWQSDPLQLLEEYLTWSDLADASDPEQLLKDKLRAMPPAELAAVVTMGAAAAVFEATGSREDELRVAKSYGIDVLAVRDKVAEDLAAADSEADAD